MPFGFRHGRFDFPSMGFMNILRRNAVPGRVFKRGEIYWIAFYSKGVEFRTSAKTDKKRPEHTGADTSILATADTRTKYGQ